MQYIIHKRFKTKAICGDVNIPAMTECEERNGVLFHNGKPLCYVASENAHQFFARNDDGNGLLRGELIQNIKRRLEKKDNSYQKRWDKVWEDSLCQKYKRKEFDDFWLWSHEFYNAPIEDLQYIHNLVKGVA